MFFCPLHGRRPWRYWPVDGKDIAELVSCVDVGGHAEAQHDHILAVEHQSAVDDVDEQVDVGRVGEVAHHGLEHEPHQFHPAELVQKVQSAQLLTPDGGTRHQVIRLHSIAAAVTGIF